MPFEQIQPNNPEQIPGFIPEETPEERRKGIEAFEPEEEKPIEQTYFGQKPTGFMGVEKTTEHIAKVQKFDQYKEEMIKSSPEKLKSFISWCEQGIEKDPFYKENYRDLQREASELILSKIKIEKAAGTLQSGQSGQAKIDINTLKNLFDFRIDELAKEEKDAQAEGNELGAKRAKNLSNKYRALILQADDLEKMIRT